MRYSKQAKTAKLNKRITFQKFSIEKNKNDVQVKVWNDLATCWASVENLHGSEFFKAQETKAEKTVKFTIRCNKNIDETMRIKFGKRLVKGILTDRTYEIKFIDDMKYDNEFMEIQALEVVPGG
jgi:SPP1 family predicted phage head-tail adaptor